MRIHPAALTLADTAIRNFKETIADGNDTTHQPLSAESEKPCQRVSNADRKVFANPESFCNKLIIC